MESDFFSDETREIFWQAVRQREDVFGRPTHLAYDDARSLWTVDKLNLDGGMKTIEIELMLVRDRRPSMYKIFLKYAGAVIVDLRPSVEEGGDTSSITIIDCVTSQRLRCPLLEYVNCILLLLAMCAL